MACFPRKIQFSWNCVAEVILSISFRDIYWKIQRHRLNWGHWLASKRSKRILPVPGASAWNVVTHQAHRCFNSSKPSLVSKLRRRDVLKYAALIGSPRISVEISNPHTRPNWPFEPFIESCKLFTISYTPIRFNLDVVTVIVVQQLLNRARLGSGDEATVVNTKWKISGKVGICLSPCTCKNDFFTSLRTAHQPKHLV